MGQCCSSSASSLSTPQKTGGDVLALVRGIRAPSQPLGNARLLAHLSLWDEYSTSGEILGSGMAGDVIKIYSKRDPSLQYALKQLKKQRKSVTSAEAAEQLLNEVLVYLEVDHVNIARIFEVYQSSSSVFLVVELCRGGDLFSRLSQSESGKFNEFETTFLISQIVRALNYLHNLGIVHGDVKLENFLLSEESSTLLFKQTVKLVDFGLSHSDDARGKVKRLSGSLQYLAPEKFVGVDSVASDMWSVGVIVFVLLTGTFLLPAKSTVGEVRDALEVIRRNKDEFRNGVIKAKLAKVGVSQNGVDFVTKCLSPDPALRLTSTDALAHPWLREFIARKSKLPSDESVTQCLQLVEKFAQLGPLRRACLGLLAMHGPPLYTIPEAPAVFNLIDSNHDGYIQPSELEWILGKQAAMPSEVIFHRLDLTGDKRVHWSEFVAATDVFASVSQQPLCPRYEALIESVFRKLDIDNSGVISQANLLALFGRAGYQGSRIPDLIREGDFVGDGIISQKEFFSLATGTNFILDI